MNEHELSHDPAFDRLRAADPARRAPDPDADALRTTVDLLLAETSRRPEPDELAVRRHRRRTPWLVAAAVAGIVAAGGGGYLAGEAGSSGTMAETAADQGPSTLGGPGPQSEGVQPLDAGDELPSAGNLVFHAGAGLSGAPGTAEVFAADGQDRTSLGRYPVVSEVVAVERLGDPRFAGAVLGSGQRAGGAGSDGQDPSSSGPSSSGPSPSNPSSSDRRDAGAQPRPGDPIGWPVGDVTIAEATLTEVRYTPPDGGMLIVPAYELADASGASWTVLAVDEDLLDLTP